MFGKIFEKLAELHNKIGSLLTGTLQGEAQGAGTVLSAGNVWIIVAVAVLAIVGVTVLVIVKKK